MRKLHVLISAGPTREPVDAVRFISNRSSGRMGYALAGAALQKGCRVTLVSGPVNLSPPSGIRVIQVERAREMRKVMVKHAPKADVIIMTAAVADYSPEKVLRGKMKKRGEKLVLRLCRTPDILKELGRMKRGGQILVGFAAETSNLLRYAHQKMRAKNLDFIVANKVGVKGVGFESPYNQAILLGGEGSRWGFARMTKIRLAGKILSVILESME